METMGLAISEAANGIRTSEEALAIGAERMQEILEGK
jgi:hypothetical protein